ncbi:MAG: radical SAM family heme chaperone HemW [Gemmatimonadota bacterium]
MPPEYLYIHVPFCVRRCGYCDFAVTATSEAPVERWLESVRAELTLRAAGEAWPERLRLATIYVGGGTPSLLGTGAMARLGEVLAHFATWDPETVEWTAEANPESFTEELAHDWRAAGVNRLSLGAQTFHEPSLRWMGRLHGAEGPARAVAAALAAGLTNYSIDLIFGLPSRLERVWSADLETALSLEPQHVSLYGLTAEPATPLGRSVQAGREELADEERYAAEFLLAAERLGAAGFEHYEVSNFARPGRESRHNRAYWQHRAYAGVGPGAHSYAPPVRSWNVRDWAEYSRRVLAGQSPEDGREELGEPELGLERVWLGLRSRDGIEAAALSEAQRGTVAGWERQGWAEQAGAAVRLTRSGWLLLDRLAVDLEAGRG